MKLSHLFTLLFGLGIATLFLSCVRVLPEPEYEFALNIRNTSREPVDGATVRLYGTESDFRSDLNPLQTAVTDAKGNVIFKDLGNKKYSFWVDVQKGGFNNWDGKKQLNITKLDIALHYDTIAVRNNTIANTLAGKVSRRWLRNSVTFNTSTFTDCAYRQFHTFQRTGFINITGGRNCANEGLPLGGDVWAIAPDNQNLLLGPGSASERFVKILEITGTTLKLLENPSPSVNIIYEYQLSQ